MPPETDQTPDSGSKSGADKAWDQFGNGRDYLSDFAVDTAACVRFFSRLPLPRINAVDDTEAAPDFSRIARAAPLAGFLIALPAAACGMLLGHTHLPDLAVATIIAALLAITTGALHEDGLSDVADGFFGGASRERRLEIMKDSRIGAFGALALVLSAILRVALLTALWQRFGPAGAALLFLGGEALSRMLLVWQWQILPPARPEGLAAAFGKPAEKTVHQALLVTIPLLIPAALLPSLTAFSLGCLFAAGAAYATGRLARAKIGGVTGDVLGAMQQLGALGFLLGLLMVP
ncbi:adenosylcobinamide-GDP ribazoletransferase [Labrenzia sp. 011]|uniref:adenosylcobinamide-GDP ribazoletransferase n=1 Tax=Labrenzia sp. 011 TaxID=2171494 RepID=UPI000D518339|nr:adenosylcobinamide-GDP ribazoletransferase [Labrenzia sp. 011]PVB63778.1 adenosylcobinamide-GDP ribazoletransferase [Labrenzia sp. 011]